MADSKKKETEIKLDEKDYKILRLEKELRFAKEQMVNALTLYDEAKQEAIRASKSRGEFISKLSHEFRTPMNALMGYSDIIVKAAKDETLASYTSGIKSATNRLLNLVNDLIEVSKIESSITTNDKEEYSASALVTSVMDAISDEVAHKGLILKFDVDNQLPVRLYGDFYHLRQIVCNLLDNAIKYTEKGYISLNIEAKINHEVKENERKTVEIIFNVEDTGCGIRKKDQDKMFTAFSQFNSQNPYANQGMGIGLTVAKYFSNKMNGDITFESKFGHGSRFTCTVIQEVVDETPLNANGDFDASASTQIVFTAPQAQILVVDDSMVNLNVAKGLLADYEIEAETAGGGYEALKMIAKKKYDIIFMDHMMPEMDGIETTKCIREKGDWCEKVPIIALTANVTDEARHMFKSEGMDDFLAKPIELPLLRNTLVKWLPKDKIAFGDVSQIYDAKKTSADSGKNTAFTKERMAQDNIDLEKGLTYFGGNLEAYKSTVSDIYKDCSKKCKMAEEHLEKKDLKNFAIEAHSAKSVSASIGANEFSEKAKEMELKAKAGDKEFVLDKGSEFIDSYEKFVAAIGAILDEEAIYEMADVGDMTAENEETPEITQTISDEEIKVIINEAITAIDDFEADEAIDKLKKILNQKEELTEVIEKIIEMIDDFEYDEVKTELKKLL